MEINRGILVVDNSPSPFLQLEDINEPSLERCCFLVGLVGELDKCHSHVFTDNLVDYLTVPCPIRVAKPLFVNGDQFCWSLERVTVLLVPRRNLASFTSELSNRVGGKNLVDRSTSLGLFHPDTTSNSRCNVW